MEFEVDFTDEEYTSIKLIADEQGVTVETYVTNALVKYLHNYMKKEEQSNE